MNALTEVVADNGRYHSVREATLVKRGPRLWLLRLASTVVGVAVLLAVLELTFWFLPIREAMSRLLPSGNDRIARFHPNRRWRYSDGWDFFIVNEMRMNNAGWVSEVDYLLEMDTPLLAFVGDSFVEGNHLPWGETCQGMPCAEPVPADSEQVPYETVN